MEEKYTVIQYSVIIVVIGLSLTIGLMIHLFIVAVLAMDRLKGRRMSTIDQLAIFLVISRIIFQSTCVAHLIHIYFFAELLLSPTHIFLQFMKLLANCCNIWLLTLISVVFCIKVSNFHNTFSVHLRKIISQRIGTLLFACVLISVGHASIFTWFHHATQYKNATHTTMPNDSQKYIVSVTYADMFAYGIIAPFLLKISSSVTLIISLYHHVKKNKGSKNVTTNLGPLYSAIRSIVICLLCYVVQISNTIIVLNYYMYVGYLWSYVIWNYFPILHSVYLIYRVSKLKSKFLAILESGICCGCCRLELASRSTAAN